MRISRAQVVAPVHKIPTIRFESQQLTSFGGLVIVQALLQLLGLRERIARAVGRVSGLAYGLHTIFLLLVVQIIAGFHALRDRDAYAEDPMVLRVLGLSRLPDVGTISRALSRVTEPMISALRSLLRELVLDRLRAMSPRRITLDFDGSVFSSRRHAEGSAVGYNKKRKGERSYYPLFCTIPQVGMFLDFLHRPGNVHDSNGAREFMRACIAAVRAALPAVIIEVRMDSAFFSEEIQAELDALGVEFTASVPFERFPQLKGIVTATRAWEAINAVWSAREIRWKPKSWTERFRIVLLRQRTLVQRKGPLQLDLFEPRETEFEFKVIVTNKTIGAAALVTFHNGRGVQEGLIGEAKEDAFMDYVAVRSLLGNQFFLLAALFAHNLMRETQARAEPPARDTTRGRGPRWDFETLGQFRKRLLQRAGRLTRPHGELTLTVSAPERLRDEILGYLAALAAAA